MDIHALTLINQRVVKFQGVAPHLQVCLFAQEVSIISLDQSKGKLTR